MFDLYNLGGPASYNISVTDNWAYKFLQKVVLISQTRFVQ